jgi:hypothetical protein
MTNPITDPLVRERQTRDELTRVAAEARYWAAERRIALNDLYKELGSWQKVADATGQTQPAVYKAAMQPHKKGTTA